MSSESDRLLIRAIRSGDQRAWQQLITLYEGRLLAFAERKLHDRASAEDIVQETFIGFLNSLPNFDEHRGLQSYLFSIAAHKITDHLRRNGRRPAQTGGETTDDILCNREDSSYLGASSIARSQERRELEALAIARALRTLIGQWQERGEFIRIQVLELLFVKGWANRDVAKFLEISEQQVANYRFAAVRKLSEHIREAGLSSDIFPELSDT